MESMVQWLSAMPKPLTLQATFSASARAESPTSTARSSVVALDREAGMAEDHLDARVGLRDVSAGQQLAR